MKTFMSKITLHTFMRAKKLIPSYAWSAAKF